MAARLDPIKIEWWRESLVAVEEQKSARGGKREEAVEWRISFRSARALCKAFLQVLDALGLCRCLNELPDWLRRGAWVRATDGDSDTELDAWADVGSR
jgi:hypothetical protein